MRYFFFTCTANTEIYTYCNPLSLHGALPIAEMGDYARRDALRVDVGKSKGDPAKTQDEVNALIAEHALAGRRVVHLKSGDPLIFGRGGDELDYLRARGIAVEVVPGVDRKSTRLNSSH